jgi:large subunit ribosomal protein L25
MTIELTASARTEKGNALDTLRAKGSMPAVVYGPKQESLSITLNLREFEKVYKDAGESSVVSIMLDGAIIPTLIHEVDHDPVTSVPRHADFYAIVKGQKVKVKIPLEFTGESEAVKAGANLIKTMHEIEVEADPMNLPHELPVDISKLAAVGDQILAQDIMLPSGVLLAENPEEVVAIAAEAKEEVVEEVPVAVDMTQIGDSVERGKKEDAEAGPEATPSA